MMLRYLGEAATADRVDRAIERTVSTDRKLTRDLGGTCTTTEFTEALVAAMDADEGDERAYVMTVYNPFGGLGAPYEEAIDAVLLGSDLRIDCTAVGPSAFGLNDIIACTAMFFGMTVVDAYPVIGDDALTLTHIGEGTLDTHPTDEGHALLAKAHRLATP
jgi:hypothetical protein